YNALHRSSRYLPIAKRHSEFPGNGWPGRGKQIELCNDGSPSSEPTGLKVLDQVSEDRRAALAVEEDDFRRDTVSVHH
ncbi:hypothetical protein AB2C54_34175, partial [Pseudomonas aeruginosa]